MLEAMGSCGLVLGTRRDLGGGCRDLARNGGALGCRRVALGFGCVELGNRGGVPGRCCSVPSWGCEDLGRGSVAMATMAASACLDDAPSCGMTTQISSLEDSDSTHAMVVGACGR